MVLLLVRDLGPPATLYAMAGPFLVGLAWCESGSLGKRPYPAEIASAFAAPATVPHHAIMAAYSLQELSSVNHSALFGVFPGLFSGSSGSSGEVCIFMFATQGAWKSLPDQAPFAVPVAMTIHNRMTATPKI